MWSSQSFSWHSWSTISWAFGDDSGVPPEDLRPEYGGRASRASQAKLQLHKVVDAKSYLASIKVKSQVSTITARGTTVSEIITVSALATALSQRCKTKTKAISTKAGSSCHIAALAFRSRNRNISAKGASKARMSSQDAVFRSRSMDTAAFSKTTLNGCVAISSSSAVFATGQKLSTVAKKTVLAALL